MITITGEEDGVVITGQSTGAVFEDGTQSATGTLGAEDADAGDNPSFTPIVGQQGTYGSFSINAAGVWSYALDNSAAQALSGGEQVTETYQVTASTADGETQTQDVVITITGENDSPIITTSNMESVDENISADTVVLDIDSFDAENDQEGAGLVYSFSNVNNGGPDNSQFNLDVNTGELTFKVSPDFEAPTDADANNQYLVQVTVTDSFGGTGTQAFAINVNDLPDVEVFNPDNIEVTTNLDNVFTAFDDSKSAQENFDLMTSSGDGLSLREAIDLANNLDSDARIILESSTTYQLSQSAMGSELSRELDNSVGDLDVGNRNDNRITIESNGSNTVVESDGDSRVFHLGGQVTLSGMTVRGGFEEGDGGGIYASGFGNVLDALDVNSNQARNGGGVYSEGNAQTTLSNDITIQNSTFSGNTAGISNAYGDFSGLGVDLFIEVSEPLSDFGFNNDFSSQVNGITQNVERFVLIGVNTSEDNVGFVQGFTSYDVNSDFLNNYQNYEQDGITLREAAELANNIDFANAIIRLPGADPLNPFSTEFNALLELNDEDNVEPEIGFDNSVGDIDIGNEEGFSVILEGETALSSIIEASPSGFNGAFEDRILQLEGNVLVRDLTVRGGNGVDYGGGIFALANDPLSDAPIPNSVNIEGVSIESNIANIAGGGVFANEGVFVSDSKISNNAAEEEFNTGQGGGIAVVEDDGSFSNLAGTVEFGAGNQFEFNSPNNVDVFEPVFNIVLNDITELDRYTAYQKQLNGTEEGSIEEFLANLDFMKTENISIFGDENLSLRQAVELANHVNAPSIVIELDANLTYSLGIVDTVNDFGDVGLLESFNEANNAVNDIDVGNVYGSQITIRSQGDDSNGVGPEKASITSFFDATRIFQINGNVVLDNLQIENGLTLGRGGGVLALGEGNVINEVDFNGNTASVGGGVYIEGVDPAVPVDPFTPQAPTTLVQKTSFTSNQAQEAIEAEPFERDGTAGGLAFEELNYDPLSFELDNTFNFNSPTDIEQIEFTRLVVTSSNDQYTMYDQGLDFELNRINMENLGGLSLREAVELANFADQDVLITFDESVSTAEVLIQNGGQEGIDDLDNSVGDIDVNNINGHTITIAGSLEQETTIQGDSFTQSRLLQVSGDAVIQDLTLTGANSDEDGGAIYAKGSKIYLDGLTVTGNVGGDVGGGIFLSDNAFLFNSLVQGNTLSNFFASEVSYTNEAAELYFKSSIADFELVEAAPEGLTIEVTSQEDDELILGDEVDFAAWQERLDLDPLAEFQFNLARAEFGQGVSLREAIDIANNQRLGDATVLFTQGLEVTINKNFSSDQLREDENEFDNTWGDFDVLGVHGQKVTIDGNGGSVTTVTNLENTVFFEADVRHFQLGGFAEVSNLTLFRGRGIGEGGTEVNTPFETNLGGNGGSILSLASEALIDNVEIDSSSAFGAGGGIYANENTTIQNSTIGGSFTSGVSKGDEFINVTYTNSALDPDDAQFNNDLDEGALFEEFEYIIQVDTTIDEFTAWEELAEDDLIEYYLNLDRMREGDGISLREAVEVANNANVGDITISLDEQFDSSDPLSPPVLSGFTFDLSIDDVNNIESDFEMNNSVGDIDVFNTNGFTINILPEFGVAAVDTLTTISSSSISDRVLQLDGNVNLSSVRILDGSSVLEGGGIYTGDGQINLNNIFFASNEADSAGALLAGENTVVQDSFFTGNLATRAVTSEGIGLADHVIYSNINSRPNDGNNNNQFTTLVGNIDVATRIVATTRGDEFSPWENNPPLSVVNDFSVFAYNFEQFSQVDVLSNQNGLSVREAIELANNANIGPIQIYLPDDTEINGGNVYSLSIEDDMNAENVVQFNNEVGDLDLANVFGELTVIEGAPDANIRISDGNGEDRIIQLGGRTSVIGLGLGSVLEDPIVEGPGGGAYASGTMIFLDGLTINSNDALTGGGLYADWGTQIANSSFGFNDAIFGPGALAFVDPDLNLSTVSESLNSFPAIAQVPFTIYADNTLDEFTAWDETLGSTALDDFLENRDRMTLDGGLSLREAVELANNVDIDGINNAIVNPMANPFTDIRIELVPNETYQLNQSLNIDNPDASVTIGSLSNTATIDANNEQLNLSPDDTIETSVTVTNIAGSQVLSLSTLSLNDVVEDNTDLDTLLGEASNEPDMHATANDVPISTTLDSPENTLIESFNVVD